MNKPLKKNLSTLRGLFLRLKAYIKRLLFPLYLFPLKLITYSAYYILRFLFRLGFSFIDLLVDCVFFPFQSFKNFWKSVFYVFISIYLVASVFVIVDYLNNQYGWWGKFFCSYGIRNELQRKVVRIVGGYSQGTGFFIDDNKVLTNFHVIADEPSPKIIFPDGKFITPTKITGDKDVDLAVLWTESKYPDMVFPLPGLDNILENEPLIATGYALGTDLTGKATSVRGNFVDYRTSSKMPIKYIQTNISLVEGMSGGPLTDQCGEVVGINTQGLAGLSLFISAGHANQLIPTFTDQAITKISVDPSRSPEDAVLAFYTYLKARKMQDGFNLLSQEYLKKTNFQEWTNRFTDILDVNIFLSKRYNNFTDTAFVKFGTKNWVSGEAVIHYYEGTWQTIKEDGVYKMLQSKILEVDDPAWDWFYEK
jgi:S1-C subfamily serine protease